ncbi:MAG: ATP-binding protein [Fibrobacterota bacterium]
MAYYFDFNISGKKYSPADLIEKLPGPIHISCFYEDEKSLNEILSRFSPDDTLFLGLDSYLKDDYSYKGPAFSKFFSESGKFEEKDFRSFLEKEKPGTVLCRIDPFLECSNISFEIKKYEDAASAIALVNKINLICFYSVSDFSEELLADAFYGHEYICHKGECIPNALFKKNEERGHIPVVELLAGLNESVLKQERDSAALMDFFEIAPVFAVHLDERGKVKELNSFAQQLTGRSIEEVRDKSWFEEFIPKEDQPGIKALFSRAVKNKKINGNINPVLTAGGDLKYIEWYDAPVKDLHGFTGGLLAVGVDITERLTMKKRLEINEKLTTLGQIAGGIAHDFNNQLGGIIGFAELIKRNSSESPRIKKYAETIIATVKKAISLTGKLLRFSRSREEKRTTIKIDEIVTETVNILQRSIDKKISIEKKLDDGSTAVSGDYTELQNALLNLALNARDAIADSGKIAISSGKCFLDEDFCSESGIRVEAGDFVYVKVQDSGEGMTPSELKNVFRPFFTTKEEGKGTGLGLALVYNTVKSHGGTLRVESEKGKGTSFSIFLPVYNGCSLPEKSELIESAADQQLDAGVMFVDDEEILGEVACEILKNAGAFSVSFTSGKEAISYYTQNRNLIDVVVLDMIMPEMDGEETFNELKKINPDLKAVIASGFMLDERKNFLSGPDIKAFVKKPFTKEEFVSAVREALES